MQKLAVFMCLAGVRAFEPPSAFQAPGATGSLAKAPRGSSVNMEDLEELAVQLNPIVGYYDPLGLGKAEFWGQDNAATIGFLRHAEIKHGRVAMAAFVGFCLQSNNIVFPWKLTGEISHADIAAAGGPPAQWDALPTAAKLQILLFVGVLELWGEIGADGTTHYMRGGVPGKYPTFDGLAHPVPFNLYDPLGLNNKKSREELDKSLLAEINNGRLAQIGIFGMLSTTKGLIVPGLDTISGIKAYDGEIMGPFTANDDLPFVDVLGELKFPWN